MKNLKTVVQHLAKMGYAARGVVYLTIGGLALLTAFGSGGKTSTSKGAMVEIYQQPFGTVMLALLVVGLVGYSVWRSIQSIYDVDQHGTSIKGVGVRGALLLSAIAHLSLAYTGIKFLLGSSDGGSSKASYISDGTMWLVVFGAGAAFCFIAGIAHIYKGWTTRFRKYMQIPNDKASFIVPVCRVGLIARGVAWVILAAIFVQSALGANNGDIKNMSDVLETVRSANAGQYVLALLAAGLFAFGLYSVSEAFYRKVDPDFA